MAESNFFLEVRLRSRSMTFHRLGQQLSYHRLYMGPMVTLRYGRQLMALPPDSSLGKSGVADQC
jgi:hypothetical protein